MLNILLKGSAIRSIVTNNQNRCASALRGLLQDTHNKSKSTPSTSTSLSLNTRTALTCSSHSPQSLTAVTQQS